MAYSDGTSLVFPKQRLTYKEKTEQDNTWGKKMIDLLVLNYNTDQGYASTSTESRYQRMLSSYQLYNNILNQKDFERDCNPFGIEVGQFQDEIRPYNKSSNKINVILGEEYKRPFNYKTILVNSDGVKSKLEHKKQLLLQYIDEYIQNLIAPKEAKSSEEDQSMTLDRLEEYMKYTYLDAREHTANQILQYLIRKEHIMDKKNDGLKHGLLSGEEHVWVGIQNNEPIVQVLNSLGVFYHKSPEVKYIQDGLYAGYRTRMSTGDILDKFGEYLKEDDIAKLERTLTGINGMDATWGKDMKYSTNDVTDTYMRNALLQNSFTEGSYGRPKAEDWVVTHVEWRSQKRVGFLKTINKFGEEEVIIVSEDLQIPSYATKTTKKDNKEGNKVVYYFDGMELTWEWIPEVWEGIRIGYDIYCCIGPKKYQYRSLDNPHKVTLGYHGLTYSAMNAEPISLMDRMKPFQYLYFIVAHKFKQLIAKDRGQVFHFDLSMVPESIGIEKAMYYLNELDIDFYDPLKNAETPGAYQRGKITGATSRSNMQFIINYIHVLAALDEQINDVAGITRQREGQTSANEAVTNAQQNVLMSANITEAVYFKPHEKLWETVLNSLVQCAQSCWAGKSMVKQYVLDDLSVQTLQIDKDDLLNIDIGVFVSNSTRDSELFDRLQNLTQALIQNDKAKLSDVIQLYKSTSVRDLELKVIASEESLQKQALEQIRAQQESQKEAQAQMEYLESIKFEYASRLQAQKDAAAKEREVIKAMSWAKDSDVNDNNVPDILELEKFQRELDLKRDEMKFEASESQKDREHQKELEKIKARNKSISRPKK